MRILSVLKNKAIIIMILIMVFYVGIVIYSDVNKISERFQEIKIEFIGVILLVELLSLAIRSFRQQKFLNDLGIKLSFLTNFKIYLAGMSMIFTPGGTGTLIKSHFLKRNYGFTISKVLPVALLERYHDLLAVTTILFFSLLVLYNWPSALIVVIATALLVSIYLIIRKKDLLIKCQQNLTKLKFLSKFVPGPELNESIDHLSRPKITALGWLISIVSWMVDAAAVYLAFLSFNQDFGFIQTTQLYFTSLGYGAISLLPGGIGVTEGSFIGLLTATGLELSTSSALVFFVRITTIWFATILGFISIRFVLNKKQFEG